MLYNIGFSDDYFQGDNFQVEVKDAFDVEDFTRVLLTTALSVARERVLQTGFNGLLEQLERRKWHIHDMNPQWITDPPHTIWICS